MAALSSYRRWAVLAILAMTLPCFAGEVAVLKNGFEIRHERRAVIGTVTRLYVKADKSSFVDVPTAEIDHFEAAPDLPVAAAVPAAPARTASANAASAGVRVTAPNVVQNAKPRTIAFPARPVVNLNQVVNDASDRYRLDPDLVNSVIKAESDFHVRAVSPKGAQGLMQLMPGTATGLGVSNAFDPQANVDGGTKYLRELLERYNFDLVKALAAYNAGPERVERFGGVPPYYETRTYVARIVKDFNKKKVAERKAASVQKPASSTNAASKTTAALAKHGGKPKLQANSKLQAKSATPASGAKN
ncbi:MAG TPA: lytic transglycosylase domain-containing protein [Candidatus Binatia bacterium]|jgi:soluble lytic murein transglycosylase-like protein|nr:lytic transglycosylase domain-containing protein [Candidatus Binatia bacterium]